MGFFSNLKQNISSPYLPNTGMWRPRNAVSPQPIPGDERVQALEEMPSMGLGAGVQIPESLPQARPTGFFGQQWLTAPQQMAAQQQPQQPPQQSPGGFFSQAGMQRQAPDELEMALQPGAAQRRYQALQNEGATKHQGFWGRLKDAGIGFLMNGIPGALTGLVAPDVIHNLRYQQELGQQGRLAKEEAGLQNTRFDNLANLRQMREQEAYRQAQLRNIENDNQFNRDQLGFRQKQEQRLIDEQARDNARAEEQQLFGRREAMAKQGGERIGLADLFTPTARTQNRGLVVPVTQGEAYRLPSQQQQDQRKLQQVTNEARARGMAEIEKRIEMLPIEMREFRDKKRIKAAFAAEKDKIDLAGVPTITQFENAKAEAKELATRASNAKAAYAKTKNEDDLNESKKLQAQADDAYGRAEAFHAAMIESGGYEDNSAGGWVGIKRKARTKKGGVVGGQNATPVKGSAQKTILSPEQVQKYAEANGWTVEQARTFLRGTGKYDLQ